MRKVDTIILGGGVTGLFTADSLLDKGKKSVLVLEKNSYFGGICSSFDKNGFVIDYGPHKLFSTLPGVMKRFSEINGEENLVVQKVNSLYFLDKKFSFPVKVGNLLSNISVKTVTNGIVGGFSFVKSLFVYGLLGKKADSFEDYLVSGFGRRIYEILFEGYAWKVWDNPLKLSKDIAEIRIPVPSIGKVLGSIGKEKEVKVNASEFLYPKNGMRNFVENLVAEIKSKGGSLVLHQEVLSVDKRGGRYVVRTSRGLYECKDLVSTLPIDKFVKLYKRSSGALRNLDFKYNDLVLVYLFYDRPGIIKDNWMFFPELRYSFNRLSEQRTFSKFTVPTGKTVLCAEITNPKLTGLTRDELVGRVLKDLRKVGIKHEISGSHCLKLRDIYPVYEIEYRSKLVQVLRFLDSEGVITLGRFGLFNYNNIDHCLDMGRKCAAWLVSGSGISEWVKIRKEFTKYKIVD